MHIKKGETVGLIGPNGAGKTTLLKLITGEKQPDSGIVQIGNNVKIGYYSQEQEMLHPEYQVIDEVRNMFNYGEGEARNILACSFSAEMMYSSRSACFQGRKGKTFPSLSFP